MNKLYEIGTINTEHVIACITAHGHVMHSDYLNCEDRQSIHDNPELIQDWHTDGYLPDMPESWHEVNPDGLPGIEF